MFWIPPKGKFTIKWPTPNYLKKNIDYTCSKSFLLWTFPKVIVEEGIMSTCLDFDQGMWDHHPLPMVMIASHGLLNVVINLSYLPWSY